MHVALGLALLLAGLALGGTPLLSETHDGLLGPIATPILVGLLFLGGAALATGSAGRVRILNGVLVLLWLPILSRPNRGLALYREAFAEGRRQGRSLAAALVLVACAGVMLAVPAIAPRRYEPFTTPSATAGPTPPPEVLAAMEAMRANGMALPPGADAFLAPAPRWEEIPLSRHTEWLLGAALLGVLAALVIVTPGGLSRAEP